MTVAKEDKASRTSFAGALAGADDIDNAGVGVAENMMSGTVQPRTREQRHVSKSSSVE
jgi:hypothetical protein